MDILQLGGCLGAHNPAGHIQGFVGIYSGGAREKGGDWPLYECLIDHHLLL